MSKRISCTQMGVLLSSLVILSQPITSKTINLSRFHARIEPIPVSVKPMMLRYTWHPGCPVNLDHLAYLKLTYLGFDQRSHQGVLIVNRTVAKEVVEIFKELYLAHFPIARMQPMHVFKGSDLAAMKANSTVGFVCRPKTGETQGFSVHSYGLAIDINQRQNPYVNGDTVLPPKGRDYLNRDSYREGMIRPGEIAYLIFRKRGWIWGGALPFRKDYMHFQKSLEPVNY